MSVDPDEFRRQIEIGRRRALSRIDAVPVAVLVWGPNPTSSDPVAQARVRLRDELRTRGHYAEFSEDLYDSGSERGNYAQQIAQAEAFDVVFSIPGSFGAVGEIHDFSRIRGISHKLIGYIDQRYMDGYSAQSLIAAQTSSTCKIELYDGSNLPDCIVEKALREIGRLQEILYISGRR